MSPTRVRSREPDQACAEAAGLARAALEDVAGPGQVGEHLGIEAAGDRIVTHFFGCPDPAYQGWQWAVTVTRAARAKTVTVDDSALLPGPDAMLAPEWVPWRDRLQPGDVGVGDLLPAGADDERLVPMVVLAGDDAVTDWYADGPAEVPGPRGAHEAPEPAFPGRVRVLSPDGRDETAERWYSSEHGPRTPGPDVEASRWLAGERGIAGFGTETVGIDAGSAGGMEPPFPLHNFLLGAGRLGLTQLANLERLPITGALLVVAPLRLVGGTGSPSRVFAFVPRG